MFRLRVGRSINKDITQFSFLVKNRFFFHRCCLFGVNRQHFFYLLGVNRRLPRIIFSKNYVYLLVDMKNSRTFAALLKRKCLGRLAQLVQSICLTSRGSAVRIRQRPPKFHFRSSKRAFSSAGSEHLPYKQRVGGSNPSTPTVKYRSFFYWAFSSAGSEHLPYKQRVGGSNPSTPTPIKLYIYVDGLADESRRAIFFILTCSALDGVSK